MSRIFITEYLASGALAGENLPPSLLQEGFSMLSALVADFARCRDVTLCTTLDERLELNGERLDVTTISHPAQEWKAFQQLAREATRTIVIAPELDHLLWERVSWLTDNNCPHAMSTPEAIQLTSDKLRFFEWCRQEEIATPDSRSIDLKRSFRANFTGNGPWIVKPQIGAGTTATECLASETDWLKFQQNEEHHEAAPFLIQPFLHGTPVSIQAIIPLGGGHVCWTPAGRQNFDGLKYQGGSVPWPFPAEEQARSIGQKVIERLPGLRGWIGFDFRYSPEAQEPLQLLEVNPRLTTSYLGYRQLTTTNLADIITGIREPKAVTWKTGPVDFTPDFLANNG